MKFDLAVRVKRPQGFRLLAEVQCETDALALVGPSGSGKSTLLDAVAGAPSSGVDSARIVLDGRDLSALPIERRRVGYVTQDPLLFPHLDVAANLSFSRRAAGADDVVAALQLGPLLERMPRHLSGGEQRRVALGRALISRPALLLLDEPFAGLDEVARRAALSLLTDVRRQFGVPMILVSHRPEEVVGVTSLAVRLEGGVVVASGPTPTVLRAGETQVDNHFTGEVCGPDRVRCDGVELALPLPADASGPVRLACYGHDLLLATERPRATSARNVFEATIAALVPAGDVVLVELGPPSLRATLTPHAVRELGLAPGARVIVLLKATSVALLG